MIEGIRAALSGLKVQSAKANANANNLANVNTVGFKAGRVATAAASPYGAQVAATRTSQAPGAPTTTGGSLDLAIQGAGQFQVSLPNGQTAYSRSGSMKIDNQGRLTDDRGNPLKPPITVPGNATSITVGRDGTVSASAGGSETTLGRIELATFNNPGGLRQGGAGLSFETGDSGQPITGAPGTGGFGELTQGALESSNVDIATEMTGMIENKAAFTAAVKAIKVADEMAQEVLNLKA